MPTSNDLDEYYQREYRPSRAEAASSPYENTTDVNFRTLSQAELIQQMGIKPRSIVDVGCGYGLLLGELRKAFPEARLAGIEVSEKCHPVLSRLQVEHAHTTLEKEGRNPFPEPFDLLVCSHVLEHSGNVPRFLAICHGMVRPGGIVFIEVPNCEYPFGMDAPHVVFFTPKTLQKTVASSGLAVRKCQPCGPSIERWYPTGRRRIQNWIEDHLPIMLSSSLKSVWRLAKRNGERSEDGAMHESAKLMEEAKDNAWFQYSQPQFKHSAIRCVAARE